MKAVFADSVYWIARVRPRDQWASAAKEARDELGKEVRLVTTDEVLAEFLTALSKSGQPLRTQAARMVRKILGNPNVDVVPQSRESFRKGLELFERRQDKRYSLQDCVSMNVMEAQSLREVLTNDRDFEQAGFRILMKR